MITVVSGLPRSGTSLMMQMLAAGGLEPLTDGIRQPNRDNPRGYYEWERIKRLPQEPGCISEAEGKVVKVISLLLHALPPERDYRLIFMLRPIEEIAASQEAMTERLGTAKPAISGPALVAGLVAHRTQLVGWLRQQPHLPACFIDYHALLWDPRAEAQKIRSFLGIPLHIERMARQVDSTLYRQRQSQSEARTR